MTKKIFRNMLITSLAVLSLSMALVIAVLYDHLYDQIFDELKNEALIMSKSVEQKGADYLIELESYNRVTLIDGDGRVIYDTVADETTMENHADREEFINAIKEGSGKSMRISSTLSGNTLYYSMLLDNGQVLRVASDQSTVPAIIKSMVITMVSILLFAVVLSVYLSRKLTKDIIRPITNIDLEHPQLSETYDEVAPLLTRIHNQNITIKNHIESLSKKQNEFTAITENMNEGFVLIDKDADILSFNHSAEKLLNVKNVSNGQNVLVLNRSQAFRDAVDKALKGKNSKTVMEIMGRFYQFFVSSVYHDEEIAGAVIIIMDITEKELHDKLRREFGANVSHELKTPLTSISGFAELIKNGMVDGDHVSEFAGDIYNEAQRLISLINDIMRISMLDNDELEDEKAPVSLKTVTEDVFATEREHAAKAGISLAFEGEDAEVNAVYAVLDEVIYNLVDNAIKYNRQGGSVTVKVTDDDKGIRLTVSDTGIGVPKEYTERIFERFFRVDKSHSKEIGGTGLGLSIVKHGAAFLGAQIEVKSVTDKGTDITLVWNK